jgi:HK97 family phage prohead protease
MSNIVRKAYPLSMLDGDDQRGIIRAIVSVTGNVDHAGERVMPGFFAKSLQKKLPRGVWGHDWKQPIAKTLVAEEWKAGDPRLPERIRNLGGYYIKGQFNLETQRGREAYSDVKFGIVDEFSVGYVVQKETYNSKTKTRDLIEGEWFEWSPVLVGMNPETALISVKSEESQALLEARNSYAKYLCLLADLAVIEGEAVRR